MKFQVKRIEAEKILALPSRTFARLESEGVIVPSKRGGPGVASIYNLTIIVPAYIKHLRSSSSVNSERDARARRDLAQAQLHELRLQERRKQLLPRDEVVASGKSFIVATRAKLLALPRRFVQSGLVAPERQEAAAGLIRESLEEMARWKTHTDLLGAAKKKA